MVIQQPLIFKAQKRLIHRESLVDELAILNTLGTLNRSFQRLDQVG